MKKLLLITSAFLILFFPLSAQSSPEKKNILILNSYHLSYKWTSDILEGIYSVLDKRDYNIIIEFMDTKRRFDKSYLIQLNQLYYNKYKNHKIDVIISSDDNAFNFLRKNRNKLFSDTPVVFCGVNYFNKSTIKKFKNYTGVNEEADIKDNIDLALNIHKGTKRIYVINDRTTTGKKMNERVRQVIHTYRNTIEFKFLDNISMNEMKKQVSSLPKNSIVYYLFFFKDSEGKYFEYDESIALIADKCKVPIYGAWDFSLGYGIIGGKLTSGFFQGKKAAQLAKKILKGEKASNIPVVMRSPNHYMFDHKLLEKHEVDRSSLPAGSIIVNKPFGLIDFYQHNRVFVLGFTATSLSIITILLIIGVFKMRQSNKIIQSSERKYRAIFENTGTAMMIIEEDTTISLVNYEFVKLSGFSKQEIEKKLSWKDFAASEYISKMSEYHINRRKENQEAPNSYEFNFIDKNNNSKSVLATIDMIPGTSKSVASLIDLSLLKNTEELLRNSLNEKEILLKEIHHRVKNNFQIITSLVNLQSDNIDNIESKKMLLDFKNRIKTMYFIHEKLYKSKDITSIDLANYILQIATELHETYNKEDDKIILETNLESVHLTIEKAIPCGLIVNEILTNSFKYAFPDDKKSKNEVFIGIKVENNNVELTISDNGTGIPPDVSILQTETLGLQMIHVLVLNQLEGDLNIETENGTKFTITFTAS